MPMLDRVLSRSAFNSSTTPSSTIPAPMSKPTSCHATAICSHTTKHVSDDATGLETPSRSQLPRMLSMTQAEFDEQVAEAIRAQSQNLTTSSTANRPNVATPNRPRRGSRTEEAMPLRQTSAEVSTSGLTSNSALEAVLELKRLKSILF